MDTLKLAIGYIAFLCELISSGRDPNDPLQSYQPVKVKKVIMPCQKGQLKRKPLDCMVIKIDSLDSSYQFCYEKDKIFPLSQIISVPHGLPLAGHSLSCTTDKSSSCNGSVMIAKIWTPEDPRSLEAKETSTSSSLVCPSSSSSPLSMIDADGVGDEILDQCYQSMDSAD